MFDSSFAGVATVIAATFYIGYRLGKRVVQVDEEEKETDAQLTSAEPGFTYNANDEFKMMLVVRNDLKMTKGKIGAQCGHAAVGAFESCQKIAPTALRQWQRSGQAKVAVKVDSEEELVNVYRTAKKAGLICCMIHDAGRTQIEPNSKTVVAIGPAPKSVLDAMTGGLKLL